MEWTMPVITPEQRTPEQRTGALAASPLGPAPPDAAETTQWLFEELAFVWADFDRRLGAIPVVARVETGAVTLDDYRSLLVNIRQQVVDGARWIALAASSMSTELFPVRSLLIRHAAEEHTDFQLLERDYCAVGGTLEQMQRQPKNIGSDAFSAYMFYKASRPDPLDLFGAMFVIEGLGAAKASGWADSISDALGLDDSQVSFLRYHGQNDDTHYDKLRLILGHPLIDRGLAERLVKTAKVVARLYALQLEELDNV
jgi:3-oxoacyl-[acyl-carrier-protein] synthase-3